MIYFLFFITIFCSAMIQGMTSFGFSLVALPILALFLKLDFIVPILVILSLGLNMSIFWRIDGKVNFKKIFLLLITGIIFTPLGVKILVFTDPKILKISVGIFIFLSSLIMIKGYKINFKNKNISYFITGMVSGILNGSLSLSGPPVVLMLAFEGESKDNFRKNLTFYFLSLNFFTIPSFISNNLVSGGLIKFLLIGFIAMFLGSFFGVNFGNRIDEKKFKKVMLFLIAFMGLATIISGI